MSENDLISMAVQLPIVGLFFWLVGKEISKLGERVDAQSKLFQELVRDTNQVIRESSTAIVSLKALIESTIAKQLDERTHDKRRRD